MKPLQIAFAVVALAFLLSTKANEARKQKVPESSSINRARVPPSGSNPFSYVPPNPRTSAKRATPSATTKPNTASDNILNDGEEWIKKGFPKYTINRAHVPPSGPNPFSNVPPNPRTSVKRDTPSATTKPNTASDNILNDGEEWIKKGFPKYTINRAHAPPSEPNPFSYIPPKPRTSVKRDTPTTTTKPNIAGENILSKGKEWIERTFPDSHTINRARVPPSGANPFSYVPPNPRTTVKRDTPTTTTKPNIAGENILSKGKEWIERTFPDSHTINRARVPPSGPNPFSYVPPNPQTSSNKGKSNH